VTVVESDEATKWILGELKSFDPDFENNCKVVFTDGASSDDSILEVLPHSKHFICSLVVEIVTKLFLS